LKYPQRQAERLTIETAKRWRLLRSQRNDSNGSGKGVLLRDVCNSPQATAKEEGVDGIETGIKGNWKI
jgi:hypothetical protein